MHNKEEVQNKGLQKYKEVLFRIAFSNLKNKADAEDAVQEAFFRYLTKAPVFENETHERAWLIRVVINLCFDMQKSSWYANTVALNELSEANAACFQPPYVEEDDMLWRVLELPSGYRNALYLFYYEDYSIKEIGTILELEENTVKTRLRRGREMLKQRMEKEKEVTNATKRN